MPSDKESEDREERFRFTYIGLVAETFGSKEQAEKTTNSMLRELELRGYKFDVEEHAEARWRRFNDDDPFK